MEGPEQHRRLLPTLDNEHLFLVRAGHPEVHDRAVVSGAETARMHAERDDAWVNREAPLLESRVVEGADGLAELGAVGRQQPLAARSRRAHWRDKSR